MGKSPRLSERALVSLYSYAWSISKYFMSALNELMKIFPA